MFSNVQYALMELSIEHVKLEKQGHTLTSHIPPKFPAQEGVLILYFALLGFVMNHNSETSALNRYKAPPQHYLCLITIWLESLEISSQQASH